LEPQTPRTKLFRPQAVNAVGHKFYGEIVLSRTRAVSWLVAFAMLVTVGLILVCLFVEVPRVVICNGEVVSSSGLLRLTSPIDGTVTKLRSREQGSVASGDIVVEIADERYSSSLGTVDGAIADKLRARRLLLDRELEGSSDRASRRVSALDQKTNRLTEERQRVDELLSLQRSRLAIAESVIQRYQRLSQDGFVSPALLAEKQQDVLDSRQKIAEYHRGLSQIEREAAQTRADRAALVVQGEREADETKRSIASLESEVAEYQARSRAMVRAPVGGKVASMLVNVGQHASAGQLIGTLIPAPERYVVQLFVPVSAAGFVREGQEVLLRFGAYPYQRFGQIKRKVASVSSATHQRDQWNALPAQGSAESMYKITAELNADGQTASDYDFPLRPGMSVEGVLVLERRKIYRLIFNPLEKMARF
jgi:membrane fusion protein